MDHAAFTNALYVSLQKDPGQGHFRVLVVDPLSTATVLLKFDRQTPIIELRTPRTGSLDVSRHIPQYPISDRLLTPNQDVLGVLDRLGPLEKTASLDDLKRIFLESLDHAIGEKAAERAQILRVLGLRTYDLQHHRGPGPHGTLSWRHPHRYDTGWARVTGEKGAVPMNVPEKILDLARPLRLVLKKWEPLTSLPMEGPDLSRHGYLQQLHHTLSLLPSYGWSKEEIDRVLG